MPNCVYGVGHSVDEVGEVGVRRVGTDVVGLVRRVWFVPESRIYVLSELALFWSGLVQSLTSC